MTVLNSNAAMPINNEKTKLSPYFEYSFKNNITKKQRNYYMQ